MECLADNGASLQVIVVSFSPNHQASTAFPHVNLHHIWPLVTKFIINSAIRNQTLVWSEIWRCCLRNVSSLPPCPVLVPCRKASSQAQGLPHQATVYGTASPRNNSVFAISSALIGSHCQWTEWCCKSCLFCVLLPRRNGLRRKLSYITQRRPWTAVRRRLRTKHKVLLWVCVPTKS